MNNDRWPPQVVTNLHLELSSFCQAQCPDCPRLFDYNPNVENHLVPTNWSLDQLYKFFDESFLVNLKSIILCGNYGDPLMFNDLAKWIEYICSVNPQLEISIHTNGGIGTEQTWQRLGLQLNRPGKFVKFALDGLEDTHFIYRRGVSYEKVLKNVQIFTSNGGRAVWKFIRFPHNAHQIELARELSKELGFYRFEVRSAYDPEANYIGFPKAEDIPSTIQTNFRDTDPESLKDEVFKGLDSNHKISCNAQSNQSIYVDSNLKAWPCCWLSFNADLRTRTMRREDFYRKVYDQKIDPNFNNLNHHTLDDILKHKFYQEILPKSWEEKEVKQKKCFPTCLEKCGS